MKRFVFLTALTLIAATILGCSNARPYGTVKVNGKVTYQDGSPWTTPNTTLYFVSQNPNKDSKTTPRIGNAVLNSDGTFDGVNTYDYFDGVIKGQCKIYFGLQKEAGAANPDYSAAELKKIINADYLSEEKTPLKFDIKGGFLDIKVSK